ncbi:MAG: TonB-dependent receptor [Prevotella sp.]|nr:TonB-dependent receptor [Prevotella sp.]
MVFLTASAQQTVRGTVKDASGEPMIGVTVAAGKGAGAVTDLNGQFTLTNVSPGTTLNISYIGYKPQTIRVGSQSNISVTLEEDNTTLEDVVVIGYGTMKRKDLTGSVASVSGDKLAANPVATVAEALQGQLPGVNVISQDGRPGGSMSIRIRGGGSITQSNDPLFIVDGVQVSSIDDIAADNIESIDVLKDAASTAIYGARGANGVILITTKGAKEGKATVKYNMYYQIKAEPDKLDVMSAYDHVLHTWSYAKSLGDTYADGVAKYYGLGSQNGNHLNDYKSQSAHNYMDDVLQSTHAWNHDVSLSGGTKSTRYYASVNYMNNDGTLINSGFRRWGANVKLSQDITKNLRWDTDLRYNEMQFKGNRYEFATQAYRYRPIDNPLGSGNPSDLGMGSASAEDTFNPVSIVNDYENLRNRFRVSANTGLTWKVITGLTAKTELFLSRNWSKTQAWVGGHTNGESYNSATLTEGDGYSTRWDTTLSYEVQGLGEAHQLNVMAGNEVLSSRSNSARIYGTTYPSEWDMNWAFGNINMTNKVNDTYTYSDGHPSHTLSWFGRANYTLLGRYMFTATFRADGSSKFSEDNRWGYFPAGAVAWRISDEPFLASTRDWMDNLKLRLSYGTSGNDQIASGLTETLWTTGTATVNGESITTYKPASTLGNPDLKWETTISRNAGLDFSFWNGKLRGSLDYYWNTTKDVLMLVPCDPTSGFSYQMQNIAETSNKGIELSLFYEIIRKKDFNLGFGMTYNFNKNKVEKLQEGVLASAHTNWGSSMRVPNYDYIVMEGEPVGLVQGMQSAGFYTVDDFNYANGVWTLKDGVPDNTIGLGQYNSPYTLPEGQKAFPGMVKYEDTNGDKVVDANDATIIGHTMPKHTGGFNFTGRYKSIDFAANFTYQLGGDIYNANVMCDMKGDKDTSLGYNRLAEVSDTWRFYDINASGDLVAVTEPDAVRTLNAGAKYGFLPEYGVCSSDFIEDATHLRLQTLTVGYTFPKLWTKQIGISNARVYFTAGNLFCLKKYSGLDPDINVSPHADSSYSGFPTPSYDFRSYPKSRTFTFGLNVAF